MPDYTFTINGEQRTVEDVPEWLPMLWVLRDLLGITGPKYGCGVGACRACTSHIAVRGRSGAFEEFQPCVTPASACEGRSIRTIEGLAQDGELHPVQQAWLELDVAQCGFCQPGQIMTATAKIAERGDDISDDDIDEIENICRCGTYGRIRQAIKAAAGQQVERTANQPGEARLAPQEDIPAPTGLPAPLNEVPQPGDGLGNLLEGRDGPDEELDDGDAGEGGLFGGALRRR